MSLTVDINTQGRACKEGGLWNNLMKGLLSFMGEPNGLVSSEKKNARVQRASVGTVAWILYLCVL